ncbi:MAG: hypothetical protein EXR98_21605 [Gemmataceae bacterium]|nr:hypothetical protein [Gemmataceae bacterium]
MIPTASGRRAAAIWRLVRGTANYFDTPFSSVVDQFRTLDRWIRMRLRCMKFKRKRVSDNWRLHGKHLSKMGFVFLSDPRAPPSKSRLWWERIGPLMWAMFMGSPGA